ncbi:restriction endonuclease subunit S [Sphingobacterium tabacisoli]|uniref:Restriction endonuclease subunit S n=1 Tax=Sphingobacterium tabacisoli TaxID=2044855 RepID=A0ABW5L086_9SPHI|nr:restriction endonuclease subunit S [Sphingobacterium tabacisoli]
MWEKVKLFDVCRPKQWKTISTKHLQTSGYPVYGANGKIGFYSEYTHVDPTLTITCRGATCGSIHITDPKSYINGNAMALDDLKSNTSIRFLYYYLKTRGFEDVISGSAQPQITREGLEKIEIPLPPILIQEKIAEILDKADELRRKDKDLRDKYDELAEAIFMDMFGDPVRNEKGWDVKTLKELCLKIGSGSTPSGGNESYKNEGISLIRSLNIHQNKFKYKDLAFIDDKQADKLKNVIVEADDILFNITGASVCRTTVVPSNVLPARVNQHVAILRFDKEHVAPFFAVRLLSNAIMNRHLYAIATQGGATREAITKEQLQKLEIIVPPIHLQEAFAKKNELINQLKAQTNAEKSEELFQSLLQKAFKYELTID